MVPARAVLFFFDVAETNVLRESSSLEFSHSLGQKAKYSLRADVFRFAPESGLKPDIAPCPKSANNGTDSSRQRLH
jgi:hypothetical protein